MGKYDIDINVTARLEVPEKDRGSVRLAWLRVFVYCIKYVYGLFMTFRADRAYRMAHNSQVCYMGAVLNDAFDNTLRRIYIDDPVYRDPVWLYLAAEDRPMWLATDAELPVVDYDAPVYLYKDSEISTGVAQFIVYYPAGLDVDLVRMTALIEKYRLPSKANYSILID